MIAAQKTLGANVDVGWTEPRLIIVAASYTKYDTYAVHQLPRSIELLRYQRYAEGVVVVDAVSESLSTKATPKPVLGSGSPPPVPAEYGLDFHTAKTSQAAREAFLELRDRILELDGVEERANQKSQITYRTTRSFCAFAFRPKLILVQFKGPEHLPEGLDPEGRTKDIHSYEWGYPWTCELKGPDDLAFIFQLVKFAYDFEQ
jgi:predicted transport protein